MLAGPAQIGAALHVGEPHGRNFDVRAGSGRRSGTCCTGDSLDAVAYLAGGRPCGSTQEESTVCNFVPRSVDVSASRKWTVTSADLLSSELIFPLATTVPSALMLQFSMVTVKSLELVLGNGKSGEDSTGNQAEDNDDSRDHPAAALPGILGSSDAGCRGRNAGRITPLAWWLMTNCRVGPRLPWILHRWRRWPTRWRRWRSVWRCRECGRSGWRRWRSVRRCRECRRSGW